MAPSAMGYFVGKFISHRKGFGFVESDEEFTQDLFIGSDDINGAMNGDRVMAEIVKPAEEGRRAEGAIVKVLKRENETVIGLFQLSNKNFGVDTGFYPLGSCTMKYNPKIDEDMAA